MDLLVKALRCVLLGTLLAQAAGCGYLFGDKGVFRDRSEVYKKSREVPLLSVPAGEDSSALQEIYPIPPISDSLVPAGKFEVPRPAPLVSGAADELVRIQTLGEESWVVVGTAPGQVWPQVRNFLSTSQIPVGRIDAQAGIIESGWVDVEGQPLATRFRFRIDQGVQRLTSELHVLQMNKSGDPDHWPQTSDSTDQESEMLRSLAQFIADSADSTPVSMMAEQAISATGKISMQEGPGGDIYILLGLPYDRAWASVDRALVESGFEITDRDRSAGKYYVRFLGTESEAEAGWFSWVWGGNDKDPLAERDFMVSVESMDSNTVAIRVEPPVSTQGDQPEEVEKKDQQALLGLIKGNID